MITKTKIITDKNKTYIITNKKFQIIRMFIVEDKTIQNSINLKTTILYM